MFGLSEKNAVARATQKADGRDDARDQQLWDALVAARRDFSDGRLGFARVQRPARLAGSGPRRAVEAAAQPARGEPLSRRLCRVRLGGPVLRAQRLADGGRRRLRRA